MLEEFIEYRVESYKISKQILEFDPFANYKKLQDDLDVIIKGGYSKIAPTTEGNHIRYNVSLTVLLKPSEDNMEDDFHLEVQGNAVFVLREDYPDEGVKNFFTGPGLAYMFPYIRSAIADLTKSANINPIVLPLYNTRSFEFTILNNHEINE